METTNISTALVKASEPGSLIFLYAAQISGQLGCVDRVVSTGSLDVCHPEALERQLHQTDINCFDLGLFAESHRAGAATATDATASSIIWFWQRVIFGDWQPTIKIAAVHDHA